jgi:hypothetical protein
MAINIAENKVRALAAVTAIFAVVLFIIPGISIKDVIGYAISGTVGMAYIFDKWLWKLLPEALLGIPKIYGTWCGELGGRWIDPDTKTDTRKKVSPFFLSIRQTFLTINVCAISKDSKSFSLGQHIRLNDDGDWLVSYIYDNTPDRRVRKKSQRHSGASELVVTHLDGNRNIAGEYWTDRWSQGEFAMAKRNKTSVNNYEAASKLHGV